MRVITYIDGLNLYHGLRDKFSRRYHWLDVERLARSILLHGQRLERVEYFIARVRDEVDSVHRQSDYLTALAETCGQLHVVEGRFQRRVVRCPNCGDRYFAYEEKETDVNIAAAIVRDAALDRYDMALVISADADLAPAIRAARELTGTRRFIAAFPPHRRSDALRRVADGTLTIGDAKVRNAQLPDKIVLADGTVIERPLYWR